MYIIRLTLKLVLLVNTCLLAKKMAKRIRIDKHERINIDTNKNKNDDMMLQITIELIIIALNIALIPL